MELKQRSNELKESLLLHGIHPDAWNEFISRLVREKINLHSLILGRGDAIVAEKSVQEIPIDSLHRQFSITKSLTSLAIGCLAEEEKLSLDDKIIDFYPEFQHYENPWLAEMTIEDMLKMETCHANTTYKINEDFPWVESFFKVEADHLPGTHFTYDTSSSHVLANLVEKLSGKDLLSYLRARGLSDCGFSDAAYILSDPQASPMGGSGLMASIHDIYTLAKLVMQGGEWKGKQVLPVGYCKTAVQKHTDTRIQSSFPEEAIGYGYQIWCHRAGWFFYGMGGQLAICVPEHQLLLVTTADVQKHSGKLQGIFDAFFDTIVQTIESDWIWEDREWEEFHPIWKLNPVQSSTKIQSKRETIAVRAKESDTFIPTLDLFADGSCKLLLETSRGNIDVVLKPGEQTPLRLPETNHLAHVSFAQTLPNRFYFLFQVVDEEIGFLEVEIDCKGKYLSMRLKNKIERCYAGYWEGIHVWERV